jgi:hypothetical protein
MASTAGKWAIGCSIGCGVVILIVVALGYGSFKVVKRTVEEAEQISKVMDEVHERYGPVRSYCPPADGSIAGGRVEAFLEVRELMAETRAEMEQNLATLSRGEQGEADSPGDALAMFKAGAGILGRIMSFVGGHGEALLAADMGPGEYTYIYVVTYYCWLGNSPADGPPFQLTGDNVSYDGSPEEQVRERRRKRTLRAANHNLRAMLGNQLTAARAGDNPDPEWVATLEAEIDAMAADPERLPWADGLPQQLEASLEPFREQLEASYSALCNPLETEIGMH